MCDGCLACSECITHRLSLITSNHGSGSQSTLPEPPNHFTPICGWARSVGVDRSTTRGYLSTTMPTSPVSWVFILTRSPVLTLFTDNPQILRRVVRSIRPSVYPHDFNFFIVSDFFWINAQNDAQRFVGLAAHGPHPCRRYQVTDFHRSPLNMRSAKRFALRRFAKSSMSLTWLDSSSFR